jgi:two-component system, chemotaxis family, protein-glutamate methylesterase/glutaminase
MIESPAHKKIGGTPGVDRRIRVMVVDDSVVIRRLITRVLEEDSALEVVGTAANGLLALQKLDELCPDIITLDIEMPELDGLETLTRLHQTHPKVRVIMFSTLTERGAKATIDSMLRGASDYVTKPSNNSQADESLDRLRTVLLPKLKQFYHQAAPKAVAPPPAVTPAATHLTPQAAAAPVSKPPAIKSGPRTAPFCLLAIGVSTGGPTALAELLPTLPKDFPLPIVITQHMPPLFTQFLADRLDSRCQIHVVEARERMLLEPGTAYIAPGDYHMRFVRAADQVRITLDQGPQENSCRPAVDVMLRSAAEVYRGDILVTILTGMGYDGRLGAGVVKNRGGYVIAQDSESSVVWGMPGAVVEAGLADTVVSLKAMGQSIMRQVGRT